MPQASTLPLPLAELAEEPECRARWPDLSRDERLIRLQCMALRGELPEHQGGPFLRELLAHVRGAAITPRPGYVEIDYTGPETLDMLAERWPDDLSLRIKRIAAHWLANVRAWPSDLGSVRATASAERRCGAWLRENGVALADRSKAEWRLYAKKAIQNLSGRSFDRAWAAVAVDHQELKKPGRKKSKRKS